MNCSKVARAETKLLRIDQGGEETQAQQAKEGRGREESGGVKGAAENRVLAACLCLCVRCPLDLLVSRCD